MHYKILILSNYIPTCFGGGHQPSSGKSTSMNQSTAIVLSAYRTHTVRLTSCTHQHRTCWTQRRSTTEDVEQSENQKVGVGTFTVFGIYRCVCVCARVHACL